MTGRMRVGKMDEHFTIEMATLLHAPQKFNMEPENDGFQKGSSFSGGWFSGSMLHFRGVGREPNLPPKKISCSASDPVFWLFSEGTAFQKYITYSISFCLLNPLTQQVLSQTQKKHIPAPKTSGKTWVTTPLPAFRRASPSGCTESPTSAWNLE